MRRILVLSCALAALTSCKSTLSEKGVVLSRSIEDFIPHDTVVLLGARIAKIQTTPVYRKLSTGTNFRELDEFVKKTRLDPRKDIDEVVFASNGKDGVLIVRGRFEDIPSLEALLEKEGAKRMPTAGRVIFEKDGAGVVFIDKSIALAAKLPYLQSAVKPGGDDNNKRNVLHEVAGLPQDKHVWGVAIGGFAPIPLPETGNLANLNRVFRSLETVTLTLDMQKGINLDAMGQCGDEKDAKQLHDMLRALIGFGRLSTPSDKPEMLRFFDRIKVDHAKRKVELNADVPLDMIDYFLSITGQKRPAA
ncbi:MAG: hypothetical protein JNK48_18125 [Bryobacterales bacterium]|nr:hypothetical protein [Bryobacterales bacterium]